MKIPYKKFRLTSLDKRAIKAYWMGQEIRKHSSPKTFPDWGIKWYSYKDVKNGKTKERYEKNKKKILAQIKEYRERNSEVIRERKKKWNKSLSKEYRRKKHERYVAKIGIDELNRRTRERRKTEKYRASQRKRERERRATDPSFRLMKNMRRGVASICQRQGTIKNTRTAELIGCSVDEFINHLERNFKRGMSWENYGTYWHVDHVLPCASFDHADPKQVKQCWHWTNLKPLKAKDNLKKSDKIVDPQMGLLI